MFQLWNLVKKWWRYGHFCVRDPLKLQPNGLFQSDKHKHNLVSMTVLWHLLSKYRPRFQDPLCARVLAMFLFLLYNALYKCHYLYHYYIDLIKVLRGDYIVSVPFKLVASWKSGPKFLYFIWHWMLPSAKGSERVGMINLL